MLKTKKLKTLVMSLLFSVITIRAAHAATYTVASGDSLYNLSKLFNTTISSLKQTNGLTGDALYIGQKLNVQATQYTVKSGDSLYLIAKNYGITIDTLRNANNKWDNTIYPGQVLLIPKAGTTSGTTTTTVSAPVIPYSASDLNLLARLIRAEAEGQPYSAKVAVGAVVVNRVQSSQFPNSISSVIYQTINGYYQFSPVLNGMINNPASQEDINAAYAALHGSDPTNGALFYFDDSATNTWLWSKPIALRSGRMVFAY